MKKLKPWIALTSVALLLTACSGGSSDTPTTDATGDSTTTSENAEPVTLTVWESLEGRSDFIKQAGEAYTALHPNVTIEYKNVELTDTKTQIALDGPAGVGADVFAAPSDNIGELVTGGHVLPVADPASLESSLVNAAIANATYDGQLYGVPVDVGTYALFYNKDMVTEVPTTWSEVVDFAKDYNAANKGKYGFVMQPSFYYSAPFMFNQDSLLFGPEGSDPTTPNISTDVSVKGLETLKQIKEILPVAAADLDTASVDALFESGQAAMHITGSWNISVFDAAGLNYGVATLPALDGSTTPSGGFSNSRTMMVSAYTEHPDEAQDFAAFLASPEMLKLAYDVTGAIPSADIEVEHEATLGMIEQGKYAVTLPSISEMAGVWTSMDPAIANIWDGADIKKELDAATEVVLAQ